MACHISGPAQMVCHILGPATRAGFCMRAHCRRGNRARSALDDLELDPCDVCHSTLPPLLLSIVAACADCGEEVPCLGRLEGGGAGSQ
eukprot:scaffold269886_cov12-Tisochrysis_lutea.AAC.1